MFVSVLLHESLLKTLTWLADGGIYFDDVSTRATAFVFQRRADHA